MSKTKKKQSPLSPVTTIVLVTFQKPHTTTLLLPVASYLHVCQRKHMSAIRTWRRVTSLLYTLKSVLHWHTRPVQRCTNIHLSSPVHSPTFSTSLFIHSSTYIFLFPIIQEFITRFPCMTNNIWFTLFCFMISYQIKANNVILVYITIILYPKGNVCDTSTMATHSTM